MQPGDLAPDFALSTDDGSTYTLSDALASGPVVLFFYPRAMTPGCTAESCHFRDLASEFEDLRAQRLGISADSVDRQRQFREKHDFDYPLLSDPDKEVAKQFGVKRSLLPFNKRATFVIGTDRRVLAVIQSERDMEKHADEALAVLRARAGTTDA
jgi:thioredoxin-dependent peroxiredoxin